MFRAITAIALILLSIPVYAQIYAPPMFVMADARMVINRASLAWHEDQASLQSGRTLAEFGVTAVIPAKVRLKYSVTNSFSNQDEVIPSASFIIGATEFGKSSSNGQQDKPKPVTVGWTSGPVHRLEATCLGFNRDIQPLLVVQRCAEYVTGMTQDTGDQAKSDREDLFGWVWGIGAEMSIPGPYSRTSVRVAGSDRLLFIDASYLKAMSRWGALGFGYRHERVRFERGTTLQTEGFYLSTNIRF